MKDTTDRHLVTAGSDQRMRRSVASRDSLTQKSAMRCLVKDTTDSHLVTAGSDRRMRRSVASL